MVRVSASRTPAPPPVRHLPYRRMPSITKSTSELHQCVTITSTKRAQRSDFQHHSRAPEPGGVMTESPEPATLPETVAPNAKIYLSPCALGPLAALAQMVAAGGALP